MHLNYCPNHTGLEYKKMHFDNNTAAWCCVYCEFSATREELELAVSKYEEKYDLWRHRFWMPMVTMAALMEHRAENSTTNPSP